MLNVERRLSELNKMIMYLEHSIQRTATPDERVVRLAIALNAEYDRLVEEEEQSTEE